MPAVKFVAVVAVVPFGIHRYEKGETPPVAVIVALPDTPPPHELNELTVAVIAGGWEIAMGTVLEQLLASVMEHV